MLTPSDDVGSLRSARIEHGEIALTLSDDGWRGAIKPLMILERVVRTGGTVPESNLFESLDGIIKNIISVVRQGTEAIRLDPNEGALYRGRGASALSFSSRCLRSESPVALFIRGSGKDRRFYMGRPAMASLNFSGSITRED
jgi:hypothetical protein